MFSCCSIPKPTVNHVISLGMNCHVSFYLKSKGYKTFSGPFDWTAGSYRTMMSCIYTKFKEFLDRSKYIDHVDEINTCNEINKTKEKYKCGHEFYGNNYFHHYNPRVPEQYEYYKRCVNRFNNIPKLKGRTLFIYFSNNESIGYTEIETIRNELQYYLNKTFELCVVRLKHYSDSKNPIVKKTIHDDITIIDIDGIESTGVRFKNKKDDIMFDKLLHSIYNFNIDKTVIDKDIVYEKENAADIGIP